MSNTLQGLRADVGAQIKRGVKALMVMALDDQVMHAEILAAGRFRFREAFQKDMGPFFGNHRGPCGDLADVVFRFFAEQWAKKYQIAPEFFLDKVEVVAPPTEQEIEDAWEVEIGSSDSAMRQMYEGSARTRKGRDLGERKTRPEPVH